MHQEKQPAPLPATRFLPSQDPLELSGVKAGSNQAAGALRKQESSNKLPGESPFCGDVNMSAPSAHLEAACL